MTVDINYVAVIVATVVSMVIGGVWYAQGVFGKTWGKLAGIKMTGKPTMENMAPLLGMQFLLSLITAYILAHFIFMAHAFFRDGWVSDGLMTALWVWLGFTASRMLTHDMFEGRRKKLTLLNGAHELVTLLAMGLVLGLLHP